MITTELYLRPQAQRYLYRKLRELALDGNQIIYSTHAPAFLTLRASSSSSPMATADKARVA